MDVVAVCVAVVCFFLNFTTITVMIMMIRPLHKTSLLLLRKERDNRGVQTGETRWCQVARPEQNLKSSLKVQVLVCCRNHPTAAGCQSK